MKFISQSPHQSSLSNAMKELSDLPDLRFLTYEELEDLTGLSRKTINEWRRNWDFPSIQKDKHCQIYFPVCEIKEWIREKVSEESAPKEKKTIGEIKSQNLLQ